MKGSIEDIRARLNQAKRGATSSLVLLLTPLSFQYRRKVLESFDYEMRALPFALQEVAPKQITDKDLTNITYTVAFACYYRGIIVPLSGARRFARSLEKTHGISLIKVGNVEIDKSSRKTMFEITNGFAAMIVRMGIPVFMLSQPSSRELIKTYFGEAVIEVQFERE